MSQAFGIPILHHASLDTEHLAPRCFRSYTGWPYQSGAFLRRLNDEMSPDLGTAGLAGSMIWITGIEGTQDYLPWAIGLGDQLARVGIDTFLVGDCLGELSSRQRALTSAVPSEVAAKIGSLLPAALQSAQTDVAGVHLVLSEGNPSLEARIAERPWVVLLTSTIPGTEESLPKNVDGVILAAAFREHDPDEFATAILRIDEATLPILGLITVDCNERSSAPSRKSSIIVPERSSKREQLIAATKRRTNAEDMVARAEESETKLEPEPVANRSTDTVIIEPNLNVSDDVPTGNIVQEDPAETIIARPETTQDSAIETVAEPKPSVTQDSPTEVNTPEPRPEVVPEISAEPDVTEPEFAQDNEADTVVPELEPTVIPEVPTEPSPPEPEISWGTLVERTIAEREDEPLQKQSDDPATLARDPEHQSIPLRPVEPTPPKPEPVANRSAETVIIEPNLNGSDDGPTEKIVHEPEQELAQQDPAEPVVTEPEIAQDNEAGTIVPELEPTVIPEVPTEPSPPEPEISWGTLVERTIAEREDEPPQEESDDPASLAPEPTAPDPTLDPEIAWGTLVERTIAEREVEPHQEEPDDPAALVPDPEYQSTPLRSVEPVVPKPDLEIAWAKVVERSMTKRAKPQRPQPQRTEPERTGSPPRGPSEFEFAKMETVLGQPEQRKSAFPLVHTGGSKPRFTAPTFKLETHAFPAGAVAVWDVRGAPGRGGRSPGHTRTVIQSLVVFVVVAVVAVVYLTVRAPKATPSTGTNPDSAPLVTEAPETLLPSAPQAEPATFPSQEVLPASTEISTPDHYVLQFASFRHSRDAGDEIARLAKRGIVAREVAVDIPAKGAWHRVVSGDFASLKEARAEAVRLQNEHGFEQVHVGPRGGYGAPTAVN